jgi:hypothetical protein
MTRNLQMQGEIGSIVMYPRHLPPAGSLGEPEMYSH